MLMNIAPTVTSQKKDERVSNVDQKYCKGDRTM